MKLLKLLLVACLIMTIGCSKKPNETVDDNPNTNNEVVNKTEDKTPVDTPDIDVTLNYNNVLKGTITAGNDVSYQIETELNKIRVAVYLFNDGKWQFEDSYQFELIEDGKLMAIQMASEDNSDHKDLNKATGQFLYAGDMFSFNVELNETDKDAVYKLNKYTNLEVKTDNFDEAVLGYLVYANKENNEGKVDFDKDYFHNAELVEEGNIYLAFTVSFITTGK